MQSSAFERGQPPASGVRVLYEHGCVDVAQCGRIKRARTCKIRLVGDHAAIDGSSVAKPASQRIVVRGCLMRGMDLVGRLQGNPRHIRGMDTRLRFGSQLCESIAAGRARTISGQQRIASASGPVLR